MPSNIRPLHFVFKISNRAKTIDFYVNTLGMTVLRHEEFQEGCDAACNGPYDGKWSKTMIGYGDEDNNFALELTYNYGVRSYEFGNDFNYIKINSSNLFEKLKSKEMNYEFKQVSECCLELHDPNGYKFLIHSSNDAKVNSITGLSLFVSNIEKSVDYWSNTLKAKLISKSEERAELSFDHLVSEFKLSFKKSPSGEINHAKAYGRVAFSCPSSDLLPLQEEIDNKKYTILTRYIELKTPGKATVAVVILADPDGHEICFVGDEGFRDLSRIDPNSKQLIDESIANDKSDQWHEKKNKTKV